MLSNSYINLISTPDEVLAYTKRKRLTPAESHILSLCTPPPNFFSPLPSCKPGLMAAMQIIPVLRGPVK